MNAALTRMGEVEQLCKIDSKGGDINLSKIRGSEGATRAASAKIAQLNSQLSLSEIIPIAAQRHSMWPSMSDLSKNTNRNDWGNRHADGILGASPIE